MTHDRRSSICVRGSRATIETFVDGSGPALIILPSYGRDSAEDFDLVTSHLAAAGWKVLRPRPRGIGGTVGPMQDVTMHDLGADIADVIEELGDGFAVILGHAYGNLVARVVATDRPELVSGVILASAQASVVPEEIAKAPFLAGDPSLPEAERLTALRKAFFSPDHDASIWLGGWFADTLEMQRAALAAADPSSFWAAGSAPLLELIPDHDPFKPTAAWHELRDQFGDRVTTRVIADASHALFPEQPEAVAHAILTWLHGHCSEL